MGAVKVTESWRQDAKIDPNISTWDDILLPYCILSDANGLRDKGCRYI